MTESDKARDELIEWFGETSKYVENEAWLDSHVKGLVMWRTARKVCTIPPIGGNTLPEYLQFLDFLEIANLYKQFMKVSDV